MKYTLLDIVQKVLSSMDADEVNSISDSVESQQVAQIVETVYYDIVSIANLPEHFTLFNLTPVGTSQPTILTKPSTIDDMLWFKYNKKTATDTDDEWRVVQYLDQQEFIHTVQDFPSSESNVGSYEISYGSSLVDLYYKNDQAPTWWTSFDDATVVCDAYDSALETNLQKAKTSCYGRKLTDFLQQDDFVAPIDEQQFNLLLHEAKALAWAEMKQAIHAKAEKSARKGWINLQHSKYDLRPPDTALSRLPNYGRK